LGKKKTSDSEAEIQADLKTGCLSDREGPEESKRTTEECSQGRWDSSGFESPVLQAGRTREKKLGNAVDNGKLGSSNGKGGSARTKKQFRGITEKTKLERKQTKKKAPALDFRKRGSRSACNLRMK